jgi:putative transposase
MTETIGLCRIGLISNYSPNDSWSSPSRGCGASRPEWAARLTKTVLETALDAEISEHLGYDLHDPAGRESPISRNGTRTKTVLTEIGPEQIEVPRDRNASFDPVIVRKRQRRLDGIDEIVLSLTARGLTTSEIAAHFEEVYGAKVSKDTISRITDKVCDEMAEWTQRPLDAGRLLLVVANP